MAVRARDEVTLTRIEVDEETQWHFWHDEGGAHVSDEERPAEGEAIAGKNVLLTGDGLHVRDGSTVLASFGSDKAVLGAEGSTASVEMCGGRARIAVDESGSRVSIESVGGDERPKVTMRSGNASVTCSDEYGPGAQGGRVELDCSGVSISRSDGTRGTYTTDAICDALSTLTMRGTVAAVFEPNSGGSVQIDFDGAGYTPWDSYQVFLQLMNDQGSNVPHFNRVALIASDFRPGGFTIRWWSDAPETVSYRIAWMTVGPRVD